MNCYEILGIEIDASFKAIKKAYYCKAKECHPDRFNNSKAKEEEFKILVEAFDVLSDPVKKEKYDLRRKARTEHLRKTAEEPVAESIMDSPADDTLEELFVGNRPPPDTSLATLFLDLANTRQFIMFREAKNHFFKRNFARAIPLLQELIGISPNNILYHCYLARICAACGRFGQAVKHYNTAVNIGSRRVPPQHLFRIRKELERIKNSKSTWWQKLIYAFSKNQDLPELPADKAMIDETNRAIANITRRRKRKKIDKGVVKK